MSRMAQQTCLDFSAKIKRHLDLAEKSPDMWPSPTRLEFKVCALLAAWEAVALHHAQAHHWRDLWQTCCAGSRTLSDRLHAANSTQLSKVSLAKSYKQVEHGMKQVYEATKAHYARTKLAPPARILDELIKESFQQGRSFACPEGLEVFLLTLVEQLECILASDARPSVANEAWRKEIQKIRGLGPPATRTLSDVTPLAARLAGAKGSSNAEHRQALARIAKHMDMVATDLGRYLRTEIKAAN